MPYHAVDASLARELRQAPAQGLPHAVALPGSQRSGRSAVFRHWHFADKPLLKTFDPTIATVHDLFQSAADRFPNRNCLGERKWLPTSQTWDAKFTWLSYELVSERRKNFGTGLIELWQELDLPRESKGVAIWSHNRPEWHIVDLGCMSQGLFTVSLYETLGPHATEFILSHVELTTVATTISHLPILLKLAPRLPKLKLIVYLDDANVDELMAVDKSSMLTDFKVQHGIALYSLAQVEKLGAASGRPMKPCRANDTYTINFTSGTTGVPKGVVLTHAACVASNCGARIAFEDFDEHDVILSYLPLAHMLERVIEHLCLSVGASVGYFQGKLDGILEGMRALQPTLFVSVPRIFNSFNSAIRRATVEAGGFHGQLSQRAIRAKMASMGLPMGQAYLTHPLYDRIWTPKIRSMLGLNRVKNLGGGSAPVDPQVQHFLSAALGARLYQGYGMTESAGYAFNQLVGDYSTGNCGPPSPCVEVCLESVPEMGYDANAKPHPRGELLMRGPIIFSSYLNNDEETSKVIEPDGWFHTGDVALIDELGRIHIIDRKKSIVKLSQGEYVAPERIENVYTANTNLIAAAFVHGDAVQSTLVGVFGVNPTTFAPWASLLLGSEIAETDTNALRSACKNDKVKAEFLKTLHEIGKKAHFNGYEHVKNVVLALEPFTLENDLLTPTYEPPAP